MRRPHAGARGQRVGDTHILPVAVPKAPPVSQMELKKEVITYADVCCLDRTCVSDRVEKRGDFLFGLIFRVRTTQSDRNPRCRSIVYLLFLFLPLSAPEHAGKATVWYYTTTGHTSTTPEVFSRSHFYESCSCCVFQVVLHFIISQTLTLSY